MSAADRDDAGDVPKNAGVASGIALGFAFAMDGIGTTITGWLSGSKRWRGTGHNDLFSEAGRDWLVYHAYDRLTVAQWAHRL